MEWKPYLAPRCEVFFQDDIFGSRRVKNSDDNNGKLDELRNSVASFSEERNKDPKLLYHAGGPLLQSPQPNWNSMPGESGH